MEQKELAQAKIDVRVYENGSDLMDEKTVVLLTEPADLAERENNFHN
jgi:cytochrome c oxidase cbb3-type subunit 3